MPSSETAGGGNVGRQGMDSKAQDRKGWNMQPDQLVRGTAYDGQIRVYAAVSTGLVQQLQRRHQLWPVATAALGRTVTVAAMMGMMHDEGKVKVQIKGDGPLGYIVADADAAGHARGYVHQPHVDLPPNRQGKLDVAGAVGSGFLYVFKDFGIGEPYRSSVPLVSGEIGEDFTYYFTVSEQTPSAVGVGVLVNPDLSVQAAGGWIVQRMPGAEEDVISRVIERVGRLPAVSSMVAEGLSAEQMLEQVIGPEGQSRVHQVIPLTFSCNCSRQRVEDMLRGLGPKEVEAILQNQGAAEVTCQFCNERYTFDRGELERLLEELKGR